MDLITATPTQLLAAVTSTATATCTTAVPDKFGYVPPRSCNANYGYYPKWEDNMAFAIAFGLTTMVHVVQAVKFKKPFCWIIIMGASWECFCFILKTLGARDQQVKAYVIVSTLLFLLAPLWINAFAYMIIARLIYFLNSQRQVLRIPATRVATFFVSADVVCFFIQAVGGALMAGGDDNKKNADLGKKIYMVGGSVQLAFVAVFVVVVVAFYVDFTRESREGTARARSRWAKVLVWVVFLVLVLIVGRIIFRLIEFSRGATSSNPILQHEWYQLYLDALPMLIAIVSLNVMHPGLVLKGEGSSMPPSKLLWWRRRKNAKFEALPLQSVEHLNRQV